MAASSLWQRFQRHFLQYHDLGFSLHISRMKFPDDLFEKNAAADRACFSSDAGMQGFDIDAFLAGAAAMDDRTRVPNVPQNAAMLLALMWYYAGN